MKKINITTSIFGPYFPHLFINKHSELNNNFSSDFGGNFWVILRGDLLVDFILVWNPQSCRECTTRRIQEKGPMNLQLIRTCQCHHKSDIPCCRQFLIKGPQFNSYLHAFLITSFDPLFLHCFLHEDFSFIKVSIAPPASVPTIQ